MDPMALQTPNGTKDNRPSKQKRQADFFDLPLKLRNRILREGQLSMWWHGKFDAPPLLVTLRGSGVAYDHYLQVFKQHIDRGEIPVGMQHLVPLWCNTARAWQPGLNKAELACIEIANVELEYAGRIPLSSIIFADQLCLAPVSIVQMSSS